MDKLQHLNVRGANGYYYVNRIDLYEDKITDGFIYYELDAQQRPIKLYRADKAFYNRKTNKWELEQVTIVQFKKNLVIEQMQEFSNIEVVLSETIDFFSRPLPPEKLLVFELSAIEKEYGNKGLALEAYQTEYHFRFSQPFVSIILTFFGVLAGVRGGPQSGNALISGLLFSSFAILIYYWGISFGINLGKVGIVWPWLAAWSSNIFFSLICFTYYLVFSRKL